MKDTKTLFEDSYAPENYSIFFSSVHFSIFKFDMLKTKVATNTKESINLVWSDSTFKKLICLIRKILIFLIAFSSESIN